MKVFLLALALFGLCSTQLRWGRCADPALQSGFSASTFNGVGYLARRTKKVPWDKKQCVRIKIGAKVGSNPAQSLFLSQYDLSTLKLSSTGGTLSFDDPAVGKGKVDSAWIPSGDLRVIKTGSSPNHAVFYSCVPFLFCKREYLWVFVQNAADAGAAADPITASALLKVSTISADYLDTINQSASCVYA